MRGFDKCVELTSGRKRSEPREAASYDDLVKRVLPALAKEENWPIRFDHCFARVVLDNTFGRCWYDALDRRRGSAISQIAVEDLRRAVELARRMEHEGRPAVEDLDAKSLAYRGKPPKRRRKL